MQKSKVCIWLLGVFWVTNIAAQDILTLAKALELATLHSPDLRQSALSLERSHENLKAQKASLKSDFDLSLDPLSYSNQLKYDDRPGGDGWYNVQQTTSGGVFSISQPILITDATIGLSNRFKWQNANGDESFYNNLTFRIDQPLFAHNKQKLALREVELDVENAQLNYALKKLSLERLITQGFYGVYKKQMQVLINEEEMLNHKRNHAIVSQKVEAGLAPLEEFYQSEVNLLSSETSLESAQVSLANAKDDFLVLLGQGFDYDFMTIVNVVMDSVPVDRSLAIEKTLYAKRELRQREIDIEMAEFSLLRIKDSDAFSGNLSFQFGLTGQDESLTNIYDITTNNTGVGLSLEVPIWDWGKRKARIRAAEIGLEKQELMLEDEKISVALTIRKLHRNLSSLLHQIQKTAKNAHNAQLSYDTNLERYKKGKLSSMDLQLFQNQLSQKKMAQTSAIINYKLELLNMKIQTLYDWERQENYFPESLFEN